MDSPFETPHEFDWHYIQEDAFAGISELPPLSVSDFGSFNLRFEGFDDISDGLFSFEETMLALPPPPPAPQFDEDMVIDVKPLRSSVSTVSASTSSGHYGTASGSSGPTWVGKEEERRVSGRRRSSQLELEEIQKYFDVPITRAAKEMNVGLTLLKKRCRELNIMRWPHRKIKSLKTLINNIKVMGLKGEIMMLEEHKRLLKEMPDMELSERTKKLRQACFKANYKKRMCLAAPT
ncbi:hypothetical protein SLEP1_g3267 [Rubroshorea leprosula]|uniref:RWP-RK domain-containing protein n=1 Tax=Rubroshorea leprosula TaxID=152421 RepID=A0AAV5HJS7_9ROSI|nr:hypothetical protein SLEP1_g3267 [Rubroshorea leprosula]